jgi:hypothetical protein
MTGNDVRRRPWDFGLTVATVVLLASLGIQSFLGTLYVWWAQGAVTTWEQAGYTSYVSFMNALAAPQIVGLVLVMGLCVPKRLFSRAALVVVSLLMLTAGLAGWALSGELATGLALYLVLAALIQAAVVVMTLAGARGPSYMTEGRLTKTGSGLLHLGFVLFAIIVAVMQRSTFMLPTFAVATVLIIGGSALSFYADRLAWRRVRPLEPERRIDF